MRNQLTEKDHLFENFWLICPLIDMFYGSVFVLFFKFQETGFQRVDQNSSLFRTSANLPV